MSVTVTVKCCGTVYEQLHFENLTVGEITVKVTEVLRK